MRFRMLLPAIVIAAVTIPGVAAYASGPAPMHRDVTVRCFPDNSDKIGWYQAEVLIHNDKRYATGLMHGFTVTALTRTGKAMRWSEGGYFKIPPFTQWGWFPTFPHHVASCSAVIRWVPKFLRE